MQRLPRALFALTFAAAAAVAASAAEERRLTGEYDSGFHDGLAPVEAVFTATGDDLWDVEFHFSHGGQDLTYSGTAKGRIGEGRLAGTVRDRGRGRTFTFRGEFEDGVFEGTHAEVRRGSERKTGGIRLWSARG